MSENLKLWNSVEKTNPAYTKNANVGGNKITSISPQYQIKNVTEEFGSYGKTWGFKNIEFDYSLVNTPVTVPLTEGKYPSIKTVGSKDTIMGLVVLKATFFYPNGEFPIVNSAKLFTDKNMSKIDDDFAKKLETDTLTKAISKIGFNADIFMGKFDDVRYVNDLRVEFNKKDITPEQFTKALESTEAKKLNNVLTQFKLDADQEAKLMARIKEVS